MKSKLLVLPVLASMLAGVMTAPVAAQDAFQNLIPDDAMGVVYIKSLGDLEAKAKRLANLFVEGSGDEIDFQGLVAMGLEVDDELDMTKPAALVLGAPSDGMDEPTPVLIIPFKNSKEAADSLNSTGMFDTDAVARGSHVAFSPIGAYKSGSKPCKLLATLPGADVVMRVDLESLIARYKDDIGMVMEMMSDEMMAEAEREGAGAAQAIEPMIAFIHQVVDSARLADVTLNIDGTKVDVRSALTVGQGTPLGKSVAMGSAALPSLAGFLPASHPVAALMSFDMEAMIKMFMPMYDAMAEEMPEEFGEAFKGTMRANLEMAALIGDGIAFSIGTGSKGIEVLQVVTSDDPAALVEKWVQTLQADYLKDMGLVFKVGDAKAVAGAATVRQATVTMDWDVFSEMFGAPAGMADMVEPMLEAMFGSKDLKFSLGTSGKNVVMALGGDGTLFEKSIAGAGAKGVLGNTLKRAGAAPAFVYAMDLRGVMKSASAMAERMDMGDEIPNLGNGAPCPVGVYAGRTGLVFSAGMHADLGQIADMFAPFMR